jgi:hypothetical protein
VNAQAGSLSGLSSRSAAASCSGPSFAGAIGWQRLALSLQQAHYLGCRKQWIRHHRIFIGGDGGYGLAAIDLLCAAVGGAVIAGAGYGELGIVLALGVAASASLILRVDDPLEAAAVSVPAS